MDRAVEAFENDFARWDLHLPPDAIEARRAGQIKHAGWSVRFNFGRDSRDDYLDYYASPRDVVDDPPSDDWHVRLYASGERLSLPTVLEAYMYGRDPTWEELERARRPFAGEAVGEPTTDGNLEDEERVPEASQQAVKQEAKPAAPLGPGVMPKPSAPGPHEVADAGRSSTSDQVADLAEATPDRTRPYLPIDIGLDIELNLTPPAGARSPKAPEPPVADHEASQADVSDAEDVQEEEEEEEGEDGQPRPPERYYPAEEADSFAESKSEDSSLSTLPLLDLLAEPDDRPAPITLAPLIEATGTTAPWHGAVQTAQQPAESDPEFVEAPSRNADVSEPEAAPAEANAPDTGPLEPTETALVAASDEDQRAQRSGDAPADNADNADSEHPASTIPTWESEFPEAAALTGPIRSRPKVFQRADLVLTADVASIDGNFDSNSFLPWWHRPGPRRIAAAAAAVLVVLLIALAVTHRRSRSTAGQDDSSDADSAASVAGPTPGAAADSSSSPSSDTVAQTQSPIPSTSNAPEDSGQRGMDPPAAEAPQATAPDVADHGSDEGMARPAGPQSISPIVPSAKFRSHGTPVRSLQGSFPRGDSP